MKRMIALSCLATLLFGAQPSFSDEPRGIYADVIRMLEAGLSEEVIVNWLVGDERQVPEASADDLIGLKSAGATDSLLDKLLELSRRGAPAPPAAPAPTSKPPAARPEQPVTAAPAQPGLPSAVPPVATAPPAAARSESEPLVSFRLAYTPPKVDFDDELWDLYVYLDGEPLAYVPPNTSFIDRGDALEFRQRLAPGRHLLLVTQERHRREGRKRWHHAARVSSERFFFDVAPGEDGEAELIYNEGILDTNSDGPLSFRFLQSDRVTEREAVGGRPESWAPICEEIEANVAAGKKPSASVQNALVGCVRWDELWQGIEGPTREQIREALAVFDYRPVPRGS